MDREPINDGGNLKLLDAHRPESGKRDLRGWEWRYLWRLCQSDELCVLGRHENGVNSIAFSPDGRVLATASIDGVFKLWDLGTRRAMASGVHSTRRGSLESMAFSPDGQLLATAGPGTGVKLWGWRTNREVPALDLPGNVGSIAFSADGQMLAARHDVLGPDGGYDSEVTVWGIPGAGKLAHKRISGASALAFSRTGTTLAVSAPQGHICCGISPPPHLNADIAAYAADTEALAFSPDGKTLASGGRESKTDASVKLWDIATQQFVRRCATHTEAIMSLAFSPDGTVQFVIGCRVL